MTLPGSNLRWKTAFRIGVAGVIASHAAMFLLAACCSGAVVPENSPLYWVLYPLTFPGFLAHEIDRSGGWLGFHAYSAIAFASWVLVAWCWSALAKRFRAPKPAT